MKYDRLFEPITINGMTLKNRIVMPAMHCHYNDDGMANERLSEFYFKRAEGGAGLIIIGGCRFDDYGAPSGMISFQEDRFIPGYKAFAAGIHARGAKVAAQLYHAGRYTRTKSLSDGRQALAPSAVFCTFTNETAKEMTRDEIKEVIQKWGEAAARVKAADFDAVEILGSAGYLICQFLSPVTNLRTDEYGGSWENRTRFPLEVIAAVRAQVGPDFPIIMRISGNDFVKGSNTNEEAVEFAKLIEKAGVDMINVTGGWHETVIPQLPGEVPRGMYTYLAAGVKRAVSIPVVACNRLGNPEVALETLAMNKSDLVGLSRVLLADPEWPNKVKEGRADEIRHCVACNQGCLANTFFGKPVECLVNGVGGHEYRIRRTPAAQQKNLLVIGGGPGGMEFALEATQRGHRVTLWEKSNRLGGQLHLVCAPEGREEFATLIRYYETMLKKRGVEVVLEKEATAEEIVNSVYDEVVIATGADARMINLPTDGSVDIVSAADVLSKAYIPGARVVVVGGGAVGCETAQLLLRHGAINADQLMFLTTQRAEKPEKIADLVGHSMRTVHIVEMTKRIGSGFAPGCGWPILKDLGRLGVKKHVLSQVQGIKDGQVMITTTGEAGETQEAIPCDTVVLAVGVVSNTALYETLKAQNANVHLLGDAQKVGKILDAIHQAIELANAL